MTDEEIKIWNRACNIGGAFTPTLPGDVALRKAISFHGVACNGGVAHSLEFHSNEIDAVVDAFRVLGAPEMEVLLRAIAEKYATASQQERSASERSRDQRYYSAMSDKRLSALFKTLFENNPSSFASL